MNVIVIAIAATLGLCCQIGFNQNKITNEEHCMAIKIALNSKEFLDTYKFMLEGNDNISICTNSHLCTDTISLRSIDKTVSFFDGSCGDWNMKDLTLSYGQKIANEPVYSFFSKQSGAVLTFNFKVDSGRVELLTVKLGFH